MKEKVGCVTLDYTWYPGSDLYSDGEVEDKLLHIAQTTPEEELNEVIAREKDWAVIYHMSNVRENIVSALPIGAGDHVLEIGSGCGAVTGALARRAGTVTCIDLSKKRSLVNAYRHRNQDNISIFVGNFQDIGKNLPEKYDWITLIGVFEYARSYIGSDKPYEEFLNQIKTLLKPGGRLVIAIENRLGLKYWAGAREDHTGKLFDGLENYPEDPGVRTFSRPELEEIFDRCGLKKRKFYYPYPDYKLPSVIWSDDYLPKKGDLPIKVWNFDRERLVLFDEPKVFDSLIQSGQFPLFSNSYLVVLGAGDTVSEENGELRKDTGIFPVYSKFSNERSRRLAIRTDILRNAEGTYAVCKEACYPEGKEHAASIVRHESTLSKLWADSGICVNRVISEDGKPVFEFLKGGHTLLDEASALWHSGKKPEAVRAVRTLTDKIGDRAQKDFCVTEPFTEIFGMQGYPRRDRTLPVTDIDMTAENIVILPDGSWNLIDYEWTFDFPVPVRFVLYRVWHYFLAQAAGEEDSSVFLRAQGFSDEEQDLFSRMESRFQAWVNGKHVALRDLYTSVTPGYRELNELTGANEDAGTRYYSSRIYYGNTGSFSEEKSVSRKLEVRADGSFTFRIFPAQLGHPRFIRWDPCSNHLCRIRIDAVYSTVSVRFEPVHGFSRDGYDEFWSYDPAYLLHGELERADEITVAGVFELLYLSDRINDIEKMREEHDALLSELAKVRSQLDAQRATKAFRAVEKVRSARNFVTIRAKAIKNARKKEPAADVRYQRWFGEHTASAEELAAERICRLPQKIKFSILMPVYNTPEEYLRAAVESVKAQSYSDWQLCIADASVTNNADGAVRRNEKLADILREYASDPRICVRFLNENRGISENTNAAAVLADGNYIALMDHDDVLASNALFEMAQRIYCTDADVVYTDEDKFSMDGKNHFDPNLKPDFSPDLLRSHNYITHFLAVRAELFRAAGGFRKEYDGAQDYDLIFRVTEKANRIEHIPKVLYYWRMHQNSTAQNPESKLYAYEAGRRAIDDHLRRTGRRGHAEIMKQYWGMNHVIYDTPNDPLVSVIIPNKDHRDDLDRCIRSIETVSDYKNLEIVVVENNSTDPETSDYYKKITAEFPNVRVIEWKEKGFNYSSINNCGVREARGDYLLFLNNDTKLIEPGSIREMLGLCMQKESGCVGAKLLYGDDTVQHAGVVLGFGGFAGHVFSGYKRDDLGWMLRAQIVGNWSAVTAACLMVRRDVYNEAGGFDESFAVALNDIDFCLKVRKAGYYNIMTPFSLWYHYESKSRGYEDTPQKKERFEKEVKHFRERWGGTVDAGDPYYNANFSVNRAPFTLW